MAACLIAVDWGSTNCRAALLDTAGSILDRRDGGGGVLGRDHTSLRHQLQEIVAHWRVKLGDLPVILSGMAGSKSGIAETPYVSAPAREIDAANSLYALPSSILEGGWIIPGVKGLTPDDVSDVMRGEEVQVFGLLGNSGWESGNGLVILPGTHSKWVLVREGAIFRFATAASGELYALLTQQGSLAQLLKEASDNSLDAEIFRKGLTHARQRGGLSHHLFNLRARAVLGEIPPRELRSRLSALIIGHELEEMLAMFPAAMRVAVVGSESLGRIYCDALAARGAEATWSCGDTAAARGIMQIARSANLVPR